LKAQFFTVSGKLLKSATFEYGNTVVHSGKSIPFVSKMTISDAVKPDDRTVLEYSNVKVGELSPATFDLNLLSR
jgi:hypothetical protein